MRFLTSLVEIEAIKTSSWRQAILAGGVLALATIGFFWQILLTANAWMPAGGGDLVPFLYPNYTFAAQHLKQGVIPLWNPHLYSGSPFAADPQSGLFYPPNLFAFLVIPKITVETLEYLAIFHLWLAGFGMYLFLQHSPLAQRLNLHPLAALTGALAFEFSDLFIVHFGNLNMIAVAAWLPLVILTFQKAVLEDRNLLALLSGVLLGTATLASHIQITLFILLALGLYTLWQISLPEAIQPAAITTRLIPLKMAFITLLITTGLSSLWLIPTFEMSQHSLRADIGYEEAAAFSLTPPQVIGLLIPNYFGRDPALHWGPWDRVETGYIGILTLLLAIMAIVLHRDRQTRFIIVLALVSFLLALGRHSILHGWLSLSPGFGQFRAPARYILLLDFALAILAATGLNQLMQPLKTVAQKAINTTLVVLTWLLSSLIIISLPLAYYALLVMQDRHPDIFRRAAAATNGVATFAILAIVSLVILHLVRLGRLRGTRVGICAAIVIMLDLFSLGANVDIGYTNPTQGFNHPEAIDFLQTAGDINRIEVTTDIWHLWQPNTAILHNLYDAWGVYNPLTLADITRYWQHVWPRNSSGYNFLGIKHIVASKAGAPADGEIVPVFDADPTVNVYLNLAALPRVLFVSEAIYAPTHEAAWQAIKATNFNPATTVVLEDVPRHAQATLPASQASNPNLGIALLAYDLHTIEIGLTTDIPGYLVLSDTYYPGWQATLDGEFTPLYRANYAFRAVSVPAGIHTVRMQFRPLSWRIGLSISILTVIGLLNAIVISQSIRQKK